MNDLHHINIHRNFVLVPRNSLSAILSILYNVIKIISNTFLWRLRAIWVRQKYVLAWSEFTKITQELYSITIYEILGEPRNMFIPNISARRCT